MTRILEVNLELSIALIEESVGVRLRLEYFQEYRKWSSERVMTRLSRQ